MKEITPTEGLNILHPLLCTLVICTDRDGKPTGMTASWFSQVSFDPPRIMVSIGKERYTYNPLKENKEFVVAIPNKDLENTALVFGTTSGRDMDKFKETRVKTTKGKYVNAPLLTDATINHECRVTGIFDAGDHDIFLADVVASWVNEGKKVLMNLGKDGNGKRIFEEF